MMSLVHYRSLVGDKTLGAIFEKARQFYGKHILHINSTSQGGGVAEILHRLVPLMNDVGVLTGWRTLHAHPDFFEVTKKFHNALQGQKIHFTERKKQLYRDTNRTFSLYTHIDHDFVVIHDPQPLALIANYKKCQPWIWRCHVDLSHPDENLWHFLTQYILRYDRVILSNEDYLKENLPIKQRIIFPAIDPLSTKNMDLSDRDIDKYMRKFGISTDKPLVTQISRYDKWKDPCGVIEVFRQVKKKVDCRLVLCGNIATDDPEGLKIYARTERKARDLIRKGDVVMITDPAASNYIFINALQRASSVIVQKSQKEGFGLVVTEALWKSKPVIASRVGGIPTQIMDGQNGFLIDSPQDNGAFADRIVMLLEDRVTAERIGKEAKEFIRKKFLITRLLEDYLDVFIELMT